MFRFKKFTVKHDRSAMKVGTDGVLLGAWAPVDNAPFSILDIGTGTGLIALMLAQRTHAEQIDALEIDEDAYEQAVENFEDSPWADRLFCFHAGLDEFIEEPEDDPSDSELAQQYDLIVSNPPFHLEDYSSGNAQRDTARFSASMPFEQLAQAAGLLLSDDGIFAVIIPYGHQDAFISECLKQDLHPAKITHVRGKPTSDIKRSLLAFSRVQSTTAIEELIIETARHQFTPDYIALTKEFYLKM